MKCSRLLATIVIFAIPLWGFSQKSLSESIRTSAEIFIYKLNEKDLQQIYIKNWKGSDDSILHTFVASCPDKEHIPPLPRGNYMLVQAVGHELSYTDHTVDNFHFSVVPGEKTMLCLYDTLGNYIDNAIVKKGSKRLEYDRTTCTYNTSRIKNKDIIEINHDGVFHYISIRDNQSLLRSPYRKSRFRISSIWYRFRNSISSILSPYEKEYRNRYTGFIVFSKPKYKPDETVKFKAYITNRKGKPYKKAISVSLQSYRNKIDTTLTKLRPYRPGMYEWQFKLSDSLKLKLDQYYDLTFKIKRDHDLSDAFYYEEYELKKNTFSVTVSKDHYTKNDTIKLHVKAHDENNMPVYDGNVTFKVMPDQQAYSYITYHNHTGFIPNLIWEKTVDIASLSAKEFILPDSIFPQDVSTSYRVDVVFLNADNEKQEQSVSFFRDIRERVIEFTMSKGLLSVKELENGISRETPSILTIYGSAGEILAQETVKLPYTFPARWNATKYFVKTANTSTTYIPYSQSNILDCNFTRKDDTIKLSVSNPAKIPFWYTIKKNKQIIRQGNATDIDYAIKDASKAGYAMQLTYLFAGESNSIRKELPFMEKNITMNVHTPTKVYPGQTAPVHVSVADRKGRPVKYADITAYAFTSKFENHTPNVRIQGKSKYAQGFTFLYSNINQHLVDNLKRKLEWDRWKERMGLDTIEYYKFLYPEFYYIHSQPAPESITQIAPYVVIDGKIEGVHVLWIDEYPYYFNQAEQYQVYSFPVSSGFHSIRLRTHDREIQIDNISIPIGLKTIISVNGAQTSTSQETGVESMFTPKIKITQFEGEGKDLLNDTDLRNLWLYMIRVENNFKTIRLPNLAYMELPYHISSGDTRYYLNPVANRRHNYSNGYYGSNPILAGPFPVQKNEEHPFKKIGTLYSDTSLVNKFELKGGYDYLVQSDFLKMESWVNSPFDRQLRTFTPTVDFDEHPLRLEEIREHFESQFIRLLENAKGSVSTTSNNTSAGDNCNLNIVRNTAKQESKQGLYPILILLTHESNDSTTHQLYYGNTSFFTQLPAGQTKFTFVFSDTTQSTYTLQLQGNGINYLQPDTLVPTAPDSLSRLAFRMLERQTQIISAPDREANNRLYSRSYTQPELPYYAKERIHNTSGRLETIAGVVKDSKGEPLPGVTVMVKDTRIGTATDINGRFSLRTPVQGNITFSFIGFKTIETAFVPNNNYNITMEEDKNELEEVVTVAYGTASKRKTSRNKENLADILAGSTPGIVAVRGYNSYSEKASPLYVVNGEIYQGTPEGIDLSLIKSINVLKDAEATALYGAQAANGVIVIETTGFLPGHFGSPEEDLMTAPGYNSLRRNFHDDAFWHPDLKTDKKGVLTFNVSYPDDITSWFATFIAIGKRKQSDVQQLVVRSFKPLNAQLSLPRFAIRNDSLNIVGKLTNHSGDTARVKRDISIGETTYGKKIVLTKSYVDTIPVFAREGDSLKIVYSLTKENGYFDGEERYIPIYEQGVLETHGEFRVVNDTLPLSFKFNPALGEITLHAEASSLELLLREIDKVDRYPYGCNEQIASKIKALLAKGRLCSIFDIKFKDERRIEQFIQKLQRNQNADNLWGWWDKNKTVHWISQQVIEALLEAEKAGYTINLDRRQLIQYFLSEFDKTIANADKNSKLPWASSKKNLLDRLVLLKTLGAQLDYPTQYDRVNQLPNRSTEEQLRSIEVALITEAETRVDMDTLMRHAHKSIMGSLYWEEPTKDSNPKFFLRPNTNSVELTLTAYRILKHIGGHEKELEQIRNYFFELRKDGSWRNTYESSRIMETIIPDLSREGEQFSDVKLNINGKTISTFPYTDKVEGDSVITIRKTGTLPVFFTAYQQAWNREPEAESKGFSVQSVFKENQNVVSILQAGKVTTLEIIVTADSDAEYVMIEVPIPAGCSYESKTGNNPWRESHREYFKEKVSIFCDRLPKGEHRFTIKLIPRYTGRYHLNPARAELMYFPTFYGRENLKVTEIK